METTIIRENLMTQEGYTPYCGNIKPRTFFNGEQFQCPHCGWVSQFLEDFIKRYKEKWGGIQIIQG